MTLLKLAIRPVISDQYLVRDGGFRLGRGGLGEEHAEDVLVQGELAAQLRERGGLGLEDEVHVEAGAVLFVGHADEIPLVHLLHGFDAAAGGVDVGGELVDDILDALFLARCVQNKQTFVSFHSVFLLSPGAFTAPLNWFIAFSIPPATQHSTWLAAAVKTSSSTGASAFSKGAST